MSSVDHLLDVEKMNVQGGPLPVLRSWILSSPALANVRRQRRVLFYTACSGFVALLLLFTSTGHVSHTVQSFRSTLLDASNATLGFEKIFVINIPARHDKRDALSLAASTSNFRFEWLDGVDGSTMTTKSKPPLMSQDFDEPGSENNTLGTWRAHMNAMQRIVKENIQSALILEDDADWDVNVKQLMLNLARGSKYLEGTENAVTRSPYGSDWDVLWMGHCGVYHDARMIQRHYITLNDPTVVPPELIGKGRRKPILLHPSLSANFTRTVFQATGGLCLNAYAISQRGARILLHQETQSLTEASVADRALSRMCNEDQPHGSAAKCVGSWPAIFGGHVGAGPTSKDSDRVVIDEGKWRKVGYTPHVVFSTRMNLRGLLGLRGARKGEIQSQWPDNTMLKAYTGELKLPIGEGMVIDNQEVLDNAA